MLDRYFDTKDAQVRAAGWALRFRKGETSSQGKLLRTLKSLKAKHECGIAVREEREALVDEPDQQWEGAPLIESFKIFQDRWWWSVENEKIKLVASYDFVQWRKKSGEQVLRDEDFAIELELQSGDAKQLAEIAEQFAKQTGWKEAAWSKFTRGLLL